MPFRLRLTLIFFALLLLSALVVPLIVPVPELETVPVRRLAPAEGRFAEVGGVNLFYMQTGSAPPTLLLLHGFGSSTFSWRKVTEPLAAGAVVIAFDRPGFGFTERPIVTNGAVTDARNPYTPPTQLELTRGLLDALSVPRAVLVGHAAGAAVAVEFALAHPERVSGLVLVAPILSSGGPPALLRGLFGTPQAARLGPLIMRQFADEPGLELLRQSYADPSRLTDADIAGFRRPLRVEGWDTALWEVTKASRPSDLFLRLAELDVPTLVVSGAADGVVPPEQHEQAAESVPGAEIRVLEGCGHAPQEECPQKFLAAVTPWLDGLN